MELNNDPQTIKQMQHIHKLIVKRIGQSAMSKGLQPLWYRSLSERQLAAAHALQYALAEDNWQGSAHRTYRQLCQLGLSPRPPRGGLRLLLQMSRGNEVAFLWFLMEMFYKTENHETMYEYNEQIIMSAIFWLDLYPTLHELDRVLPLPHASTADRLKQDQAKACQLQQQQKRSKWKRSVLPLSPYFQKPKVLYPRQQQPHAFQPKEAVKLPLAEGNLKPSSICTRWFGDCNFNELLVQSVLNNEINDILASLGAADLDAGQVESMCMTHKEIRSMEQSLKRNLERIKLEQRERLLDVNYPKREKNRRLALEHLDRLTEKYQKQFHKIAVKTRVASTRKRLCADLEDPGFIYLGDCKSDEELLDFVDNSHTCFKLLEGDNPLPSSCQNTNRRQNKQHCLTLKKEQRPSRPMQLVRVDGTKLKKENEPTQFQCHTGRSFFNLGNPNAKYYSFNYRKLFTDEKDKKLLNNQQLRLKAEFIKALDDDVEYLNAVLEAKKSGSMDGLVDRAAKSMFKTSIDLFEEIYKQTQARELEKPKSNRLNFGQDFYDADDLELMKEMLRLGLERVAEDRRYVLPSLPDVHCIPMLQDWIRCRYGKRYTQAERKRRFSVDKSLMDHLALILDHLFVRAPRQAPLSRSKSSISYYAAHNEPRPELRQFWDQYMKNFTVSLLEIGRIYHYAMKAHQNARTSALYNAYMPAHLGDLELSYTKPSFSRRSIQRNQQ